MSGAEHRRASAFIGGFKQLRLFHFSFINHASRTKFDHFVNFVSTKRTQPKPSLKAGAPVLLRRGGAAGSAGPSAGAVLLVRVPARAPSRVAVLAQVDSP